MHIVQDPQAFADMYRRHVERVVRYVQFRVPSREDAQDIVSTVFLRAFEHRRSFRATYAFSTWIFTIARNAIIDHYRATHLTVDLDHLDLIADGTIDIARDIDKRQQLDALFAQLTPTERILVTLKFIDGYSHKEIAALVGKSTDAVKKSLERLRKRLATYE